jgi:hypothetical protein
VVTGANRQFGIFDLLEAMTLTAFIWGSFTRFDRAGGFVSLGLLFGWLVYIGLREVRGKK